MTNDQKLIGININTQYYQSLCQYYYYYQSYHNHNITVLLIMAHAQQDKQGNAPFKGKRDLFRSLGVAVCKTVFIRQQHLQ